VVVNVVKDGKWQKVGGKAKPAALPDLGGKEVIVAVENAYPPYNFIDQKTKKGAGWDYDAWNEICKKLNCKPKFVEAAWDGIFEAAAAGQYDVVADGVTITEKRKKVVAFSDPYMTYGQVILVRANEKDITDKDALVASKDKLVGVQLGTTNEDTAKQLVGKDRVKSFDTFDLAVIALMSGDVDAVIIDSTAASGFIAQNPSKLKIAGDRFTTEQLGFVFQKGSDLIAPTNAALAAMKADGSLAALYKKWFEEYKPVKEEATPEAEATKPAEEATPAAGGGAAVPPAPDMAAVTPLLTKGACGSCHVIPGVKGAVGTLGPDLCDPAGEFQSGEKTLATLKADIVDPNAEIMEGFKANIMPSTFGKTYSADEINTLVAFIANLKCAEEATPEAEATKPAEKATPAAGGGAAVPPAPDMAAVTPLLTKGTCGACHVIPGVEGAVGTLGPSLCDTAEEFQKGEKTLATLKADIVDPNAEVMKGYSANIMPSNYGKTYTADEIDTLVAFTANLKCK